MILYTKLIIGLQLRILRMDIHSMPEIAFHFKISWYGMTWLFLAYFGSTGKSETLISELKNTEYRIQVFKIPLSYLSKVCCSHQVHIHRQQC